MQQLKVTRELDVTGAVLKGFGVPLHTGDVFYVNGSSGVNNSDGKDPDKPLLTIAYALDLVTADHNDYIVVLDHYTETFPIACDVAGVRIICAGSYNIGHPMVYLTSASDTCFTISANFVEIAGFEFGSSASNAAIESGGTYGYGLIHDCAFGSMQTGQDGIKIKSGHDAVHEIIEDCLFGSGLTRDGIRSEGNATRGIIRRNTFRRVTGIGIDITNNWIHGIIGPDNRFMLPSDTAGKAITLGASCSGIYVVDNKANYGDTDSMAQIPWADGGSGDANTWDNNLTAGVVDYPA